MKKILASFALILLSFVTFGQGMQLNENLTWAQVLEKASKENKSIFVDAYTTWCGPCKWMAKNVFPKDSAGNFYNANFVCYKFDMEKGEGIDFARKYQVAFYPSYLFFDKKGELVHRSGGSKPLHQFIEDGKRALDPERQLVTLQRKFNEGTNDKKVVHDYALAGIDAGDNNPAIAEKYFQLATPEERLSSEAFMIYSNYSDVNSESFRFLKAHAKEFKDATDEDVKGVVIQKYADKVHSLGKAKDLNGLSTLQSDIEKDLGKLKWKEMQIEYYIAAKDHTNEFKLAEELISDPQFNDENLMNNLAWDAYQFSGTTQEELINALKWSERSIKLRKDDWAYIDTYAHLLYRLNKLDEAAKYAKQAISIAESKDQDCKETKDLLKMIEAAKAKQGK
jgi:thioredoxin-related protein